MCEFCNNPFQQRPDKDSTDLQFAGFFSAEAIEAAVRQANASREQQRSEKPDDADDQRSVDTDGT